MSKSKQFYSILVPELYSRSYEAFVGSRTASPPWRNPSPLITHQPLHFVVCQVD